MTTKNTFYMTKNSINTFLEAEATRGLGPNVLRVKRRILMRLYDSLPRNKVLSRERIETWRQGLREQGYAEQTVINHIKCVNNYLSFEGRTDLQPVRSNAKDLTGRQFGELTVLELTNKKWRSYRVWRCKCSCGREKEIPSEPLLSGNTTSCGCKKGRSLEKTHWYYEGTDLYQALEEKVESTRSSSGYTGVTLKRNKWVAYITYKKKRYFLGSYDNIEEAVEARARAKALVMEDAEKLVSKYKLSR